MTKPVLDDPTWRTFKAIIFTLVGVGLIMITVRLVFPVVTPCRP